MGQGYSGCGRSRRGIRKREEPHWRKRRELGAGSQAAVGLEGKEGIEEKPGILGSHLSAENLQAGYVCLLVLRVKQQKQSDNIHAFATLSPIPYISRTARE